MTQTAGPLPGVSSVSTITDWETLLGTAMFSGVQPGQANALVPSLDSSGRNAVIGTGKALLRGFFYETDASVSTAIPAASGQNRIDRLTLRMDRAAVTATTFIVPHVITGTPGANPQEPALVQTATGLWDLPIMSWQSASSGALNQLKDERYFGAAVLSGVSASRPAMAGPGLLTETDTGMVALWDGSAWNYVAMTPDTPHVITNFASTATAWHGSFSYAKVAPGLVAVAVQVSFGSNAAVADGTVVCNISKSYAPPVYHHIPLRCDALKVSPQSGSNSYESAGLAVRADGSVAVYGVSTGASVLEGTGSYPLTF